MAQCDSRTSGADDPLGDGGAVVVSKGTPTRHLVTAAWILFSAMVVVLLGATALRMRDTTAGGKLAGAIVAGERPVAPELPATRLATTGTPVDETDWYPGLPSWYGTRNGRQLAAGDNEVLVVNWWASWCGPCREEAPHLLAIADAYRGRATIVGVNAGMEDLESDARAFVEEFDLDFPIVRADRSDKDAWGVRGYPETFVVGRDARISARIAGQIDPEQLRSLMDEALDAEAPVS